MRHGRAVAIALTFNLATLGLVVAPSSEGADLICVEVPGIVCYLPVEPVCVDIPIFLTLVCKDQTRYTIQKVREIEWWLDGAYVTTTPPRAWAVLPYNELYIDFGRNDHVVEMKVTYDTQTGSGSVGRLDLPLYGWPRFVFIVLLVAVLLYALWQGRARVASGRTAWPRSVSPAYRMVALSKKEDDPEGYISYKLRDAGRYDRFQSRNIKIGNKRVIVVYGIRNASAGERARTGSRRIAEVQTVRERVRS